MTCSKERETRWNRKFYSLNNISHERIIEIYNGSPDRRLHVIKIIADNIMRNMLMDEVQQVIFGILRGSMPVAIMP